MKNFTRMDRIWVATALLLHPETGSHKLVSQENILNEIKRRFPINVTSIMIRHHLVNWVDRQADKNNPKRGGSRNRYLFRTLDGKQPSEDGMFRLYKLTDAHYDGWDKTGKVRPERKDIPSEFTYLLDWHIEAYFEG